jgi:hypothetical protein
MLDQEGSAQWRMCALCVLIKRVRPRLELTKPSTSDQCAVTVASTALQSVAVLLHGQTLWHILPASHWQTCLPLEVSTVQ